MTDWRDVPDWAVQQQKRQEQADAWAQEQYTQLASQWVSTQPPMAELPTYYDNATAANLGNIGSATSASPEAPSPDLAAVEPAAPPSPPLAPAASNPSQDQGFIGPPAQYANAPVMSGDLTVNQFGDPSLTYDEALAACGPAAAVALAAAYGNQIPLKAALEEAKKVGWTAAGGMNGIQNQKRLLDSMGIATRMETNVDWNAVVKDATAGNPVIISTPNHYYFANAVDPQTGKLFVGQSGLAFKQGGGQWMSPQEIMAQGGGVNGALFADSPASQTTSVAGKSDKQWYEVIGDAISSVARNGQQSQPQVQQETTPDYQALMAAQQGGQTAVNPYAGQTVQPQNPQSPADVGNTLGQIVSTPGAILPDAQPEWEKRQGAADAVGRRVFEGIKPTPEEQQNINDTMMYVGGMTSPMNNGAAPATAAQKATLAAQRVEPHGLNINLPKYIPEEVQGVIRDAYEANPARFDTARRGVVPDEAIKEMANQLGENAQQLASRWKPGDAKNAETIYALRDGLAKASQDVLGAQEALRAAPQSADALNAFAEALTKHAAVQEAVTGVTAEAGRALRQFRQPVRGQEAALSAIQRIVKNNPSLDVNDLANELSHIDLSDPDKVANLARTLTTHSFGDKLQAVWYFNLLSSPMTHIKNTVSNALVLATRPLETAVAVPIEKGIAAARGRQSQRSFGEVPAQVAGTIAGVEDGLKGAWDILRRGYSSVENGSKVEMATREPFKGQVAAPLAKGDLLGAAQGVGGNIVNAPSRALRASDVLFRTMNKYATLYSEAYRIARTEGLNGEALVDRVAQLRNNPTAEMIDRAEKEAAYRVFQQDGDFVKWAGQKPAALKLVIPFVQTPYNIAKYSLERSPLALYGVGKDALQGNLASKGLIDFSDRTARFAVGSTLMGLIGAHAANGNVTAAAPTDPAERDAFYRQGKQPYSLKGPDGNWISYAGIQPFTTVLAAGATAADLVKRGKTEDGLTLATLGAYGAARSVLDQPWTDGISEFIDFMSGANVRDPQDAFRVARDYAEHQSGSVVPSAVRFLERATDSAVRDPEGPVEAIQASIPGLSGSIPARQDAMGKDARRPAQGLAALNPFTVSDATSDPVERELERLQKGKFDVQPGFVGKRFSVAGQQIELDREQRRQYQKLAGGAAYGLIADLMASPEWKGYPDATKAAIINRVVDRSREVARAQLSPALADQAAKQRVGASR